MIKNEIYEFCNHLKTFMKKIENKNVDKKRFVFGVK